MFPFVLSLLASLVSSRPLQARHAVGVGGMSTVSIATGTVRNKQKRMGFALCLELACQKCGYVFGNTYSSPELPSNKKPSPFVINDTMTLLFNHLGLGHTALKEFCGVLGMPAMCLKTFQKKEWQVVHRTLEATGYVLNRSVAVVRAMHYEMQPDFPTDQPVPITFSFDGTWHKRGHMSMHGVAAVIEVVTGLVVDYVVLSTYCHQCSVDLSDVVGPVCICCANLHAQSLPYPVFIL